MVIIFDNIYKSGNLHPTLIKNQNYGDETRKN